MLTIDYIIVSEYGTVRRRIVNENDATKAFTSLTGRKTLTQSDVQNLKHMGVELRDRTHEAAK
jgi:hypothetical protein